MAKKKYTQPKRVTDELLDNRSNYLDKQFEQEKRSQVYSTEVINKIKKDIDDGIETDMMPFFHGKTEWKNADLVFEYTEEEWEEMQKCASDCIYFVENYCTFQTDRGRRTVQLRNYQKEVLDMMGSEKYDMEKDVMIPLNRYILLLMGRQCSKSTTSAAFLVFYLIFHTDRNCAIVSNKMESAEDLMSKICDIIRDLTRTHFWLAPGIKSISKTQIKFENGCSLVCTATTGTALVGRTINGCVIWDEAALVPQNIQAEFFQSIFPTLSSSDTGQMIICSTPRGRHNKFYELYEGAINNRNGFVSKTVYYYDVPGHDTPEWKAQQIAIFGEASFAQEFELSFDADQSKLVAPKDLSFMRRIKKQYRPVDIYGIPWSVSQKIFWHPDFHPDALTESELLNYRYFLQVDTAQGKMCGDKGQEDNDWNIINIYRVEFLSPSRIKKNRMGYKAVTLADCIRFRQIGIYMDQDFNEEHSAEAAKHLVFTMLRNGQILNGKEVDNCRISIEINFNGANWIRMFAQHDLFYPQLITKTLHSQNATKKNFGFKTVSGKHGKGYFCEDGARRISQRQIIVSHDSDVASCSTIQQLENFGKSKSGVYDGGVMHDDIAVTVLFVSIMFENEDFIQWIEDWFRILPQLDITMEDRVHLDKIGELMNAYFQQTYETEYSDEELDRLYSDAISSNSAQSNSSFGFDMGNGFSNMQSQVGMNPYQRRYGYGNGMMGALQRQRNSGIVVPIRR